MSVWDSTIRLGAYQAVGEIATTIDTVANGSEGQARAAQAVAELTDKLDRLHAAGGCPEHVDRRHAGGITFTYPAPHFGVDLG